MSRQSGRCHRELATVSRWELRVCGLALQTLEESATKKKKNPPSLIKLYLSREGEEFFFVCARHVKNVRNFQSHAHGKQRCEAVASSSSFFFSFAAEQIPEDILHVRAVPEDMRARSCLSRQATGLPALRWCVSVLSDHDAWCSSHYGGIKGT